MDFVEVMLFTQQLFHLECLFFFCLLLILEIVYYFRLNLSQMLLIKMLFTKKHVTLFFSLVKMKK